MNGFGYLANVPKTIIKGIFKGSGKLVEIGHGTVSFSFKLFQICLIIFILYKLGIISESFLLGLPTYLTPIFNFIKNLFKRNQEYILIDEEELPFKLKIPKPKKKLSKRFAKLLGFIEIRDMNPKLLIKFLIRKLHGMLDSDQSDLTEDEKQNKLVKSVLKEAMKTEKRRKKLKNKINDFDSN